MTKWNLFYAGGPLPADPASIRALPESITYGGQEIRPLSVEIDKVINLVDVLDLEPEIGREALLIRTIHSDRERTATMGCFADWWCSLHVNGVEVDTTFPNGCDHGPFGLFNHLFPVPLEKGENLLVFRVKSGLAAWWAACDEVPFVPAAGAHETVDFSRQAIMEFVLPSRARILHGPRVCRLAGDEACITFQSDGPMAAAIDYRAEGDEEWHRAYDAVGVIPNAYQDAHAITLRHLEPGRTYEYRVVLFKDYKTNGIAYPPGGGSFRFTTFTDEPVPYGVFLAGDLQMDYCHREKDLSDMQRTLEGKRFDFNIHLGDLSNNNDSFERETLRPMDLFPPGPFFPLVGNHERCGLEASDLNRFFFTDGRSFHAFRHGDAFWFLLDTGTDFEDRNDYGDLNALLLEEEVRWIDETVKTEACRSARWRIVASHHAPPACRTVPEQIPARTEKGRSAMTHHAVTLKEALLRGCDVDLWIAGHTHAFLRTFPNSSRFLATRVCQPGEYEARELVEGPGLPFPVVIPHVQEDRFGGVEVFVTRDHLEVESVFSDGVVLDRFRLRKGGAVCNLGTASFVGLYERHGADVIELKGASRVKSLG